MAIIYMQIFHVLAFIYLVLYILHLVYGPYFYRFMWNQEEVKFRAKNTNDVLRRSLFITYVSFLFTISFLLYPTKETLVVAFLYTIFSLLSYLVLYYHSDYFQEGLIDHFVMLLPFSYFFMKMDHSKWKWTSYSLYSALFFLFIALLFYNQRAIYKYDVNMSIFQEKNTKEKILE